MGWKTTVFSATGKQQSITLFPGTYKIECWGAQGGSGRQEGSITTTGGKGAYVSGIIGLKKRKKFYIYVGTKGGNATGQPYSNAEGGWNGGGKGGADCDDDGSGGGGGASDVRLVSGDWNSSNGLRSRIIVAAGGSGSSYNAYGAPGGALSGYISASSTTFTKKDLTAFGIGEDGKYHQNLPSSGAGGGYFAGSASDGRGDGDWYKTVSASGSSYVSGFSGCKTVDENGIKTDSAIHYSKIEFFDPIMLDGLIAFDDPSGITETGHSGDGSVKITQINVYPCSIALPYTHRYAMSSAFVIILLS